jgi:hypothetical protein
VSSPESTASNRADSNGKFSVSASSFRSSTCRVSVGDGFTSTVAGLSGCTPTSTTTAPALSSLSLSHLALNLVGTFAVGEVLLASVTTTPVTIALTSSHPGIAALNAPSVRVEAGFNQAVFLVQQVATVATSTAVTIAATADGVTRSALLTIDPTLPMAFFAASTTLGPGYVGANFVDTAATGTTLGVSNPVGCVRFAIIAGQLPSGLFLFDPNTGSTPCKIPAISVSGVPTTVQTSAFTLEATDELGQEATIEVTVTINPPLDLTIAPQLPWSPIVGSLANLWITGGGGVTPYTWSRTAGQFPPGMSLVQDNRDGPLVRVTGTPTTAGTYSFTLRLVDGKGAAVNQTLTVTVGAQ